MSIEQEQPTPPGNAAAGGSSGGPGRLSKIFIPILLAFAALGYLGFRWMHNDALATLLEYTGTTERDSASSLLQWSTAAVGDDFHAGDGARTADGASAAFRLSGHALLKLKPASQVRFHRSRPDQPMRVDVEVGEANVESGTGAVTLDSEFGPIALDANSSITMSRQGDRLSVAVELGSIRLSEQAASAGERVVLELGGLVVDVPEPAPTPPAVADVEPAPEPELKLDVGDGVPSTDLVVAAGSSFAVHDAAPPTAIGFSVAGVCSGPARLTADDQVTEAVGQVNLRFERGKHSYEVRCLDRPDDVAATGSITILNDAGSRKLPAFAATANVATDGRRYTVMYQGRLPNVTVSWPTAPRADSYTLTLGTRVIVTKRPSYTLNSLARGTHRVLFSAATTPARQSRTTTIEVAYDTQAPAAQVAEPPLGFAPSASVTVRGNALPGWTVSVGGRAVEVDAQRNFSTQSDGRQTIPIVFSHPEHGTHFYLRRPKGSP